MMVKSPILQEGRGLRLWREMLNVEVDINGEKIAKIKIRRELPVLPGGDTLCLYSYEVEYDGQVLRSMNPVEHRYGDGALILVSKVLKRAGYGGLGR